MTNLKKSYARRHIALTSYDPVRAPYGDRGDNVRFKIVIFGPKMIVDSLDSRREPARSPHNGLAGPIKSYGHRTVTLW